VGVAMIMVISVNAICPRVLPIILVEDVFYNRSITTFREIENMFIDEYGQQVIVGKYFIGSHYMLTYLCSGIYILLHGRP
jgi:predicted nicotinamide N-methyase